MKLKIVVLNVIFAILLTTFLYSALNIDVEVSATRAPSYIVRGDNLLVNVPVTVRNGGMYPVENVHVKIIMENNSSTVWEDEFLINRINGFYTYTKNFILKINLTELYEKLGSGFALNGGELNLKILIHANYWILAEVNALNTRKIWWDPLINSFNILTSQIEIKNDSIFMPYLLKSRVPVNGKINLVIRDSEGMVAKGSSDLICGKVATVKLNLLRSLGELKEGEWEITAILEVGALRITKQVSYDFSLQNMGGDTL